MKTEITDEMTERAAKVAWEWLSPYDKRVPWEQASLSNRMAERTKAYSMLEAALNGL